MLETVDQKRDSYSFVTIERVYYHISLFQANLSKDGSAASTIVTQDVPSIEFDTEKSPDSTREYRSPKVQVQGFIAGNVR